jgi:beta-lactamase class C
MRLLKTGARQILIKRTILATLLTASSFLSGSQATNATTASQKAQIQKTVDNAVGQVMRDFSVPGMAVAITFKGERHFFNYGFASIKNRKAISNQTLFEIGSISKTFAASLASYAIVSGKLKLSDSVTAYLPYLKGSAFDKVSILNLATYTSGGLPLQVPETIHNEKQLIPYLQHWQPTYPPGTHRIYSNPSIGLLGMAAAKSLDERYEEAVETKLFLKLGMTHSYLDMPTDRLADYADGHTTSGAPARSTARVLSSPAYGVKSCTQDLIQYLEANMGMLKLDEKVEKALIATHQSYYKCGPITQDLVWEQFSIPAKSKNILAGSSDALVHSPNVVTAISPPERPDKDVLIHKTGSTNGFSAYAVFIPSKQLGVVMLANKNLEIAPRLKAAFKILTALDDGIIF